MKASDQVAALQKEGFNLHEGTHTHPVIFLFFTQVLPIIFSMKMEKEDSNLG